jgi:hypothetical protein
MNTIQHKLLRVFLRVAALAAIAPSCLHAQAANYIEQTFDGNICGLDGLAGVSLAYDGSQDDTGNGGGSCHVSTDYSLGGFFGVTAANEACCFCTSDVLLQASNYTAVEFDVKWDNSSTVPPSFFNTSSGGGSQGIVIVANPGYGGICYSNVLIPDAATNGWVHLAAAIDPATSNGLFSGLVFMKPYPAYGPGAVAAFWLDNIQLAGRAPGRPWETGAGQGGIFTLRWNAVNGATYSVFKSTNLADWATLATGYPAGGAANGPLSYRDTNASGSRNYYRLRYP